MKKTQNTIEAQLAKLDAKAEALRAKARIQEYRQHPILQNLVATVDKLEDGVTKNKITVATAWNRIGKKLMWIQRIQAEAALAEAILASNDGDMLRSALTRSVAAVEAGDIDSAQEIVTDALASQKSLVSLSEAVSAACTTLSEWNDVQVMTEADIRTMFPDFRLS